jgi:solute carrier family 25 (mitochondrial carnitine/acylcarnitine transporter), member 20/29
MYFLTYEYLKKLVAGTVKEGEKMTPTRELLGTVFAGGMAGVANWTVGMPQDVLKSRLQTAPEGTYPNGMRDVFRQLMKNEGPMALYKGFVPVMTRAVPANAACFIGLELCMRVLNVVAPNL